MGRTNRFHAVLPPSSSSSRFSASGSTSFGMQTGSFYLPITPRRDSLLFISQASPLTPRIVDNGTIGPSPLFSIFVALLPAHDTGTVLTSGMRLTQGEEEDANCARWAPQIYGSPISREGHRTVILNPRAFRVSFVPKASQDDSIRHHPNL